MRKFKTKNDRPILTLNGLVDRKEYEAMKLRNKKLVEDLRKISLGAMIKPRVFGRSYYAKK